MHISPIFRLLPFFLLTVVQAQSVLVHDARNFTSNTAMQGSRIRLVDASGTIKATWADPRLRLADGVALSQRCLWSPNVGYNPNARLNAGESADVIETLSCISRTGAPRRDTWLKGFQSVEASVTSDGKAVIVGSATSTELARVSDDGQVLRRSYANFSDGIIVSTLKSPGKYVHASGRYAQVVGTRNFKSGVLIINERNLKPLRLIYKKDLTMRSVFAIGSQGFWIIGVDEQKRTRLLKVNAKLKIVKNVSFPCGDKLGGHFFASSQGGFLGFITYGKQVVKCFLDGSRKTIVSYDRPVTKVILKGDALFAFGGMGTKDLLISRLKNPTVRSVRVADSIIDLQ